MGISLKTHKLLWGLSGTKCAFEECRNDLIVDETETDDESIIGEEAHIVAKSNDGPRGNSTLSIEDRDKYDNLILLCRKHHKIIDDQFNFYTVKKLKEIKSKHEAWVIKSLKFDKSEEKDGLAYATYIDEIIKILDFENWEAWTSYLLGSEQSIDYSKLKELEKLLDYIISRFWPKRYIEIENIVFNVKAILNDFLIVYKKYAKSNSYENEGVTTKEFYTERFYKTTYHSQEVYNKLLKDYDYHCALVDDLILELTRSANLLIEKIRKYIYPMFRDKEGKLLVTSGPGLDFSYTTHMLEYNPEEKLEEFQYKGLKDFMTEREKRDLNFGKGFSKNYFPFNHK